MPRWVWFVPILTLIAGVTVLAYRIGWLRANLTETDVIEYYAQRYEDELGGSARKSDCFARPGETPGIWLVVFCGQGATARRYAVNRMGALVDADVGPAEPEA